MRPRDEHKEQAIRQKSIEIMVTEGIDGLSMQKLAREAGVSPATIYIYFKDRQDLILQVSRHTINDMLLASLEGFDPGMHFDEGLRIQWKNRAKYYLSHPLESQFLELIKYSNLYEQILSLQSTVFHDAMKQFVQNALKRRQLVPLPFEVCWSVAFAPLYQLLKFHSHKKSYLSKTFKLSDKMLSDTLELVLKALRPAPET
jgi:AcrR family transcriptional regulator